MSLDDASYDRLNSMDFRGVPIFYENDQPWAFVRKNGGPPGRRQVQIQRDEEERFPLISSLKVRPIDVQGRKPFEEILGPQLRSLLERAVEERKGNVTTVGEEVSVCLLSFSLLV